MDRFSGHFAIQITFFTSLHLYHVYGVDGVREELFDIGLVGVDIAMLEI